MRHSPRARLLVLAAVLTVVPFGLLLWQVEDSGPVTRFDREVVAEVNDWAAHSHSTVTGARAVTQFGGSAVLLPVALVTTVALLLRRRARFALFVVVATIGAAELTTGLKAAIDRPRPEVATSFATPGNPSFPSGHALNSTAVFGAVLLVTLPVLAPRWRRAAIVGTVLLVAAVGLTRIVLGVHYPSDVLAGHVLAVAWLALVGAVVVVRG